MGDEKPTIFALDSIPEGIKGYRYATEVRDFTYQGVNYKYMRALNEGGHVVIAELSDNQGNIRSCDFTLNSLGFMESVDIAVRMP